MITGLDLVELQIMVARGEKIPFAQEDLKIHGHALELRVYAEDPLNNFLPSVGTLEQYQLPQGPGIRVDGGFEEGMEVPIYYDPMLAKLVVHGATRSEAIQKMKEAIAAYKVDGVSTTLPFGQFVMDHEAFVSGDFDTHFVQHYYTPEKLIQSQKESAEVAALLGLRLHLENRKKLSVPTLLESNWKDR
jgi:acetyl/propionyl-CoA carboxylase alpha subunit